MFVEICSLVPEKNVFEEAAILIMCPNEALYNLASIDQAVPKKIKFQFIYVNDLWPRSSNDLENSHLTSFKSISCLYQITVRSQATKIK